MSEPTDSASACREALDWLYGTQMFGIKLGLEGITRLLGDCGVLHPRAQVIHVAGTNGKGSTCAFAESVARAAGYGTGLFTSPHLVRFNERIRVNGEEIPDADLARLIGQLRRRVEGRETMPTFFELTLAIALMYFAEREVDLIILETGMGGRLDATNAVPKDVAVIAPIGLDHRQYLGDTLYEIAGEKAAIIAPHRPAVSAPQQPDAKRAIDEAAARARTECRIIHETCELPLGLRGSHQKSNAALALAALRSLPGFSASDAAVACGLAEVRWPGRFEEIAPGVIMDGAHNPPAMRVLVQSWREAFGERRARCIFAGSADKDLDSVLSILSPIVSGWVLPPVQSPRILPASELAAKVRACSSAPLSCPATLSDALRDLPSGTLICGSFFLLGEAKALLASADYRRSAQ
ncbi:MAG TPA: bifunctional folylpolyglutamate synthase/dihydrofolate synthase [Candidatus Akkermansia intestinigallinarum]|uniref:Dihydrofolate synthase/folylpolyglutamate synthase n=1 Tax=Candidatus Akkermansia intestinigallinarum TaxID=2838431 RepID=A0A9D2AHH9_9BACT|nr:bifunctional folylpolyglutamate synthase/dihydrofolate synthase [Candidatus Akkermansia intestinigallinarum]